MADLPKLSKPIAEMTPLELENYRRYLQDEIRVMTEQIKEIEQRRTVLAKAAPKEQPAQ